IHVKGLLGLASAMLLGGWRSRRQRFSRCVARQYASMLALAVIGMAIPSLLATVGEDTRPGDAVVHGSQLHQLSIGVAIILLVCYAAYIAYSVFGLHASHEDMLTSSKAVSGDEASVPHNPAPAAALAGQSATQQRKA